jgi:hypothetical protein
LLFVICYYSGMTTPTPEEIRDQVLDDVLDGSAEIQIGDRRVRKLSPAERLDALKSVQSSERSPFIKVGLKKRSF